VHTTPQIRDSLRAARLALQQDYFEHGKAKRLLLAHARLVDKHLCDTWQMLDMPAELALMPWAVMDARTLPKIRYRLAYPATAAAR